jgi:hypothetical protein
MQDDLKKYTALEALSKSEGGKVLMEACLMDIIDCVDRLSGNPHTLENYIMISCRLTEKLATYRILKNAEENINLTKIAIEEALKAQE